MLIQIIGFVVGKTPVYQSSRYRNGVIFECSKSELIEVMATFDFYWNAYQADLKFFFKAFVYRNSLFYNDNDESDDNTNRPKLSKEEIRKIVAMMDGIEQRTMYKQLKSKK